MPNTALSFSAGSRSAMAAETTPQAVLMDTMYNWPNLVQPFLRSRRADESELIRDRPWTGPRETGVRSFNFCIKPTRGARFIQHLIGAGKERGLKVA